MAATETQVPYHRPARRQPVVLGFALLLILLAAWFVLGTDKRGRTARLQADAWYHHAWLPTLVLDGDLDLSDEYAVFGNFYGFGETRAGLPANVFGVGPAVFELPLFVMGHALAGFGDQPADGFSRAEIELSLFASVLFGFGSIVFVWRVLQRHFARPLPSAAIAALVFLAGPSIYYAVRQPGYAHPFAAFFIAWLIDVFDASFDGSARPRSIRTWLSLGALLGAATLARPQLALWGVVLVLAAVDDWRRQRSPLVTRWSGGALAALAVFAPQLVVWKLVYGSVWVVPQGAGFMWWSDPAWTSVLFSSRNGLLPWTPLYAMALVGLLAALRRHARIARALLLGLALQLTANASAWDWWGGGSFGGRRFDSCYVAFAFGLGFLLLAPAHPQRRTWAALRVASALLSVVLMSANLVLVSKRSGGNVPIGGGRPAWSVWREEVPGALGAIAGSASWIANLPAQIAFAWRHGVPLDRYDQIVGVHALDDRFPGLNADRQSPAKALPVDPRYPNVFGTVTSPAPGSTASSVQVWKGEARWLVGFNRRDPVAFSVEVATAEDAAASIRLTLNGEEIGGGNAGRQAELIVTRAALPRRGTNVLVIEARAPVVLHALTAFTPQPLSSFSSERLSWPAQVCRFASARPCS